MSGQMEKLLKWLGFKKEERTEGIITIILIVGTFLTSIGIGLSILTPKGISAILTMLGAFAIFVATTGMVFAWLLKELKGE